MSGPPHHFIQNMNGGMRSQFGPTPMQNQIGGSLQNAIPVHMQGSMGAQMNPLINPMSANVGNQMQTNLASSTPMLGQMNPQYNINANTQIAQHPSIPQATMGEYPNNLPHHAMQQGVTSQVIQQPAGVTPTPPAQQQQQQQQSKELNTASLCRIGQETVQDIVSRTQEVFQTLRAIQPPNGTSQSLNASNEKKAKVQEQLRTIRVLFKRLRLIYEKCNENCQLQGMEYTHIESLIPFKDEIDPKHDEKKNSEAYRLALEENKEVMEQVVLKNKQLKEVIDHLRRIIWEINTMLTMRRS